MRKNSKKWLRKYSKSRNSRKRASKTGQMMRKNRKKMPQLRLKMNPSRLM
jgi:hypothetical protein